MVFERLSIVQKKETIGRESTVVKQDSREKMHNSMSSSKSWTKIIGQGP